MTSILAPAAALKQAHGELFRQLGATEVRATAPDELTLTYTHNANAVNADALLKDVVNGARIVVDNQSLTKDMPVVDAYGVADVLRGVEGLEMRAFVPRCQCPSEIIASSGDAGLVQTLQQLVEPKPAELVSVTIMPKPAPEPAG